MASDVAFTLSTQVSTPSAPGNVLQTIGAGYDGSLWAVGWELQVFDPIAVNWVTVDAAINIPGNLVFPQYIAAVSQTLCYYLKTADDGTVSVMMYQNVSGVGSTAPLAAPPATPTAISAGWDATLWIVCGTDLYAYDSSGGSWSAIASPSGTLSMISVGNAGFILALVTQDGVPSILSYADGAWSAYGAGAPSGTTWIGACGDGAYWTFDGETLTMTPSLATAAPVTFSLLSQSLGYALAAATQLGCYFWSTGAENLQVQMASWGILDTPAVAFPTFVGDQLTAFNYINTQLSVTNIRQEYANLNASLSSYQATITVLPCPTEEGVSESDWTTVKTQILAELGAANGVRNFFSNLASLDQSVASIQTDEYNSVVAMVGLPAQPSDQPSTLVQIVLQDVFDDFWSAAQAQVSAEMGGSFTVASDLYTLASQVISYGKGATPTQPAIQIPCSELAATLAATIAQVATTSGDAETTILGDWGKMSACSEAINTNFWYWTPHFDGTFLTGLGPSMALQFYQTLMPVQWSIFLPVKSLEPAYPPNPPQYTGVFAQLQDSQGTINWYWICVSNTASPVWDTQGPWPAQALIDAVTALSVKASDIFLGQNGWNLPQLIETDYSPPPSGAVMQPWVNSTNLFGSS